MIALEETFPAIIFVARLGLDRATLKYGLGSRGFGSVLKQGGSTRSRQQHHRQRNQNPQYGPRECHVAAQEYLASALGRSSDEFTGVAKDLVDAGGRHPFHVLERVV
jgi:hypothetical protein